MPRMNGSHISRQGGRSRLPQKTRWIPLCRPVMLAAGILLLGGLFYPRSTLSQPLRLSFRSITLDDGLSQSTARCMLQDRKGFIWIGTADGLNRYDGYTFTVFKAEPGSPAGLGYSVIRSLHEDRQGLLWIGTEGGGLYSFDPTTERFTHFGHDPRDTTSLSNNYVWTICEDSSGGLWLGTDGGGINCYRPEDGGFTRFQADPADPTRLRNNRIWSLSTDPSGMIWVGTNGGGLHRLDPKSGIFERFPRDMSDPGEFGSALIQSLLVDRSRRVWIGTDGGGLLRFDPDTKQFARFRHNPHDPASLASDRVINVFEDSHGALWIGTNGAGLDRLVPPSSFLHWRNDINDPESLTDNRIWSILEDRTGGLWVGTEFGGICRYDAYSRKFKRYAQSPWPGLGLNDRSVWSLLEDSDGTVWIGTASGGLNIFDRRRNRFSSYQHDPSDPSSLSNNHVRTLYMDRSGTIWVGTHGGGLSRVVRRPQGSSPVRFQHYSGASSAGALGGSRVYSILEDRRGFLWVSTRGSGVHVLDRRSGAVTNYHHTPEDSTSLPDDFIYTIVEDRAGSLWFGTFTSGLARMGLDSSGHPSGIFQLFQYDPYDPATLSNNTVLTIHEDRQRTLWIGTGGGGLNRLVPSADETSRPSFRRFTERDGLPSNFVYGILEDASGVLWISTNRGICKFDPQALSFHNYDVSDGLQSNEFNGGAYYQSPRGEMFFGGIDGFNIFMPERVKDNPHIPPIYITGFRVFNLPVRAGPGSLLERHITETADIVLAYDQNDFSLEFTALDYSAPEKNRYRYMLLDADVGWVDADASHREASYMNLSPGEYLFRVRGSNNDGKWNEEGAMIRITITPPYWERWWFRIAVVAALSFLLYIGYRRRLRTERMRTELSTAHTAQMSIMPQTDPDVKGFEISGTCLPAHEVGGDFFDYMWLTKDHTTLCIAVGDVSGKAMDSAMTAVLASGMIASKAEEGATITSIMSHLNRSLHAKTKKSMFTALCLAALDMRAKTVTFTNAGLVRPILKSGQRTEWLHTEGSKHPLGILSESGYGERTLHLKKGDVVVFVTDGVTEEQDRSRELYGDLRLFDLVRSLDTERLSARSIKESILADVKRFSDSTVQDDDITVVVVKAVY